MATLVLPTGNSSTLVSSWYPKEQWQEMLAQKHAGTYDTKGKAVDTRLLVPEATGKAPHEAVRGFKSNDVLDSCGWMYVVG